jgi:hypothetical protein
MARVGATTTYSIELFVNGGDVHGDLQVSGFATLRTANEVGAKFAKTLREHFPGAEVRCTPKVDRSYLRSTDDE